MDSKTAQRRLNAIQGHLVPVVTAVDSHSDLRVNLTAGEFVSGTCINMHG